MQRRAAVAAARDRKQELREGRHAERHRAGVLEAGVIAAPGKPKRRHADGRHEAPVDHDLQPAAPRNHRLVWWPRRAAHDVGLRRLDAEGQRWQAVGHKIQPENLDRGEGRRPARDRRHEHQEHLAGVARQQVVDELLDVVVDASALLHGCHDRGEVVVGEHHVGRLAGDVGAGDAHRDPDVGGLHRRGVVDAVAGHGDHVAESLQRPHDPQLVLGRHAGVDRRLGGDRGECGVVERVDLQARHRL